jgi:hypothetical protein
LGRLDSREVGWKLEDSRPTVREYDICLSFAGEQRAYVSEVADALRASGIRVFYDEYERAVLWGKDLYEHLAWVYGKASRFCIMFASKDYAEHVWTSHERRSAQARAIAENREYILPVIFDDTEIPGINSTIGYLDARTTPGREVARLAVDKLGPIQREDYLPPDPDLLFDVLKLKAEADRERAKKVAASFLRSMKRATVDERRVVGYILSRPCASDGLNMPHVSLDIMRRDTGLTESEIMPFLHGLYSIGFRARIDTSDGGRVSKIYLKWEDMRAYTSAKMISFAKGSSTKVAAAMMQISLAHYCEDCAVKVIERLDFSGLSSA